MWTDRAQFGVTLIDRCSSKCTEVRFVYFLRSELRDVTRLSPRNLWCHMTHVMSIKQVRLQGVLNKWLSIKMTPNWARLLSTGVSGAELEIKKNKTDYRWAWLLVRPRKNIIHVQVTFSRKSWTWVDLVPQGLVQRVGRKSHGRPIWAKVPSILVEKPPSPVPIRIPVPHASTPMCPTFQT